MRHIKKTSLVVMVLIAILGVVAGQNIIGNYYYSQSTVLNSQSADSVVYIENGVSGVVTIVDPYLNRTTDINVVYAPLDSGSGFIVNSEGYIVTAFHVVSDPQTLQNQRILKKMDSNDVQLYIERAAVTGYITRYNPQLGSELINYNIPGNAPVIQAQPNINSTTDLLNGRNLLKVKSAQQLIRVKLPGTNSGNSINANLVDVGNSGTDEDVAVLKIDTGLRKLPSLSLNSKTPVSGEKIQIYGYPVINSGMYSDTNQSVIKPSSTAGVLTSQTNSNGTVYYQTDALTIKGYSGGPVLDSQNSVLGIVIYSVESSQQFNQQSGLKSSLFLSSKYIIDICNKNNISINII
jgi:S1-C subfamily serine protease